MEGAPVYVYDEGGAHQPIGDDGEDEHDEDHDEEEISKEQEKIDLEEELSKEQDAFNGALQLPALCNGDSSGFQLVTQGSSDADEIPHVLQTPARSKDDGNVVQPHSRDTRWVIRQSF